MSKVTTVCIVLVLVCLFSSGACDPARRQTPYAIVNQSSSDIVFSYYYVENKPDIEDYLLKSLQRDIEVFNSTGSYYGLLQPNGRFTVKTYGTREELLVDSSRALLFVWVHEARNLKTLETLSSVTFDDVDFFFLGTAKDLAERNWEIVYHGKDSE